MANKPLKSIKFPGLPDTYTIEGMSEEAKIALLACFEHVAWVDEHGKDYYDALEDALYPETGLVRITAVFTQGSAVVYEGDNLNDLKAYLVVTGYYNNGTSKTETDYALIGELTTGVSVITVSKNGKTTTFNVTVTPAYWDYQWNASNGTLPTGMTASAYDFTTEAGALYAENPRLDIDHVGNMRILIECKLYAFNTELQQESYRNFPQIVIANGNGKGCKLIASYNTNNPNGYVAFGVNNVNTLVDGVSGMEWHTYDINSVSGTHTLKVDNVTADIPQNTGTSQYITSTGIVSGYPEAPLVYVMCLKQFKYKIL